MSDVLKEMAESDVLQKMTEAVKAMEAMETEPTGAEPAIEMMHQRARDAENALLRHLAREAVLAGERDACVARHEQLTRALVAARQVRDRLAKAVQDAGGKLPQWEL